MFAQGGHYELDHACSEAYRELLALNMDAGHKHITEALQQHPDNLLAVYIADYEDCLPLLLNCDAAAMQIYDRHFATRVHLLEQGDNASPWHLFCLSGLYLHRAEVLLRMGDQVRAALDFNRSYGLIKKNSKQFPGFAGNNSILSTESVMAGALPGNMKWLAAMLGIRGNINAGTDSLHKFILTHTDKDFMVAEARLYYAYLQFYVLYRHNAAIESLTDNNSGITILLKAVMEMDDHRSEAAQKLLEHHIDTGICSKYPVYCYEMGQSMYTRLDTNCRYWFRQYIAQNKSGMLVKDAWLKLANTWYLKDDAIRADSCWKMVLTAGSLKTEADKLAMRIARKPIWANKVLLKARLLTDGGYDTQALALLQSLTLNMLPSVDEQSEYYYRLGAAYEGCHNTDLALKNFTIAVTRSAGTGNQFGARALLHKGLIFESQHKSAEAKTCFQSVLDQPEHDLKNNIDQQARAGLSRLQDHDN